MTLKIIGAGFGRTGTHSLKLAIERLGFGPCHHMFEVRRSARQIALWTAIADGHAPSWDAVFQDFNAQVDWPGSRYWQDLAQHYPNAKVILTVRDPEDWYASITRTILRSSTIGRTEDPDPKGRAGSEIIYRIALQGIFDGRLADKAHALAVFARHRQAVVDSLPPKRLLVFDTKDGWAPLCGFLGAEHPGTPFPAGNTTAEFISRKSYL